MNTYQGHKKSVEQFKNTGLITLAPLSKKDLNIIRKYNKSKSLSENTGLGRLFFTKSNRSKKQINDKIWSKSDQLFLCMSGFEIDKKNVLEARFFIQPNGKVSNIVFEQKLHPEIESCFKKEISSLQFPVIEDAFPTLHRASFHTLF